VFKAPLCCYGVVSATSHNNVAVCFETRYTAFFQFLQMGLFMKKVVMIIIEKDDFSIHYECSGCGHVARATQTFEKSKTCPKCKAPIDYFETFEDESEES